MGKFRNEPGSWVWEASRRQHASSDVPGPLGEPVTQNPREEPAITRAALQWEFMKRTEEGGKGLLAFFSLFCF